MPDVYLEAGYIVHLLYIEILNIQETRSYRRSLAHTHTGTDLGGFQGAEGTPWAPQGVPVGPVGLVGKIF